MQGKLIAEHQQPTLAAMEGLFESQPNAPLVILGQPDVQNRRLDNPLQIPGMLSFLTYRKWTAHVKGLDSFPEDLWPDRIPLLYQLSRDGGAGDDFHCSAADGGFAVLEEKAVSVAVDAVGADAMRAAAIRSEHGGMDHRGS